MRIGVFDSGIGGITVLKALRERFLADFFYLGDTAHVPYGTRSPSQIRILAAEAVQKLVPHRLDLLVVACNTASSLAMEEIRHTMGSVPVIGVVEAGLDALRSELAKNPARSVLILATRATVRSRVYSQGIGNLRDCEVSEQECPLLVPLIEEGWLEHPVLVEVLREYTRPHLKREPGVALLACTHFPWIRNQFQEVLPGWRILDSASALVTSLDRMVRPDHRPSESRPGKVQWIFTDACELPSFAKDLES